MKFWKRWISDYKGKTAGCSLAEVGAYDKLLDEYYAHERALPNVKAALYRICGAMNGGERRAVDAVSARFFVLGDDGLLHNGRADEYIAEEMKWSQEQRARGARGAALRWNKDAERAPSKPNGSALRKIIPFHEMGDAEIVLKANARNIYTPGLTREQIIKKLLALPPEE